MFKVDRVIFERQGLVFFVEQHDFDDPWIRDRRFDQRRTITYFGDPSGEHTVKHYCFIDIDFIFIFLPVYILQGWPDSLGPNHTQYKTNPAKGRNSTSILHVPLWLERHQSVFTHVR